MLKEDYKKKLDDFLRFYEDECQHYIKEGKKTFAQSYFADWFENIGKDMIQKVVKNLDASKLDDRLEGFVELYRHYIKSARNQQDEDLILENLFAIPNQMQQEFSVFGFLQEEAAASDDMYMWDIAEIYSYDDLQEDAGNSNQKLMHTNKIDLQYLQEPDFDDQVLVFKEERNGNRSERFGIASITVG